MKRRTFLASILGLAVSPRLATDAIPELPAKPPEPVTQTSPHAVVVMCGGAGPSWDWQRAVK